MPSLHKSHHINDMHKLGIQAGVLLNKPEPNLEQCIQLYEQAVESGVMAMAELFDDKNAATIYKDCEDRVDIFREKIERLQERQQHGKPNKRL